MIGEHQWYSVPDEKAETWCLLIVRRGLNEKGCVEGWEMGFGNSTELARKESAVLRDTDSEKELLQKLLVELRDARYSGVTLITPSPRTLAVLRGRFLCYSDLLETGFRGFTHLDIESLLFRYFLEEDSVLEHLQQFVGLDSSVSSFEDIGEELNSVEDLWNLISVLGPVVPRDEIQGTPV